MRLSSLLFASFMASTVMSGPASSQVFFRGSEHVFVPTQAPTAGTDLPGTETEIGIELTGDTEIAYGEEWDILIEATNAPTYSLTLTGVLPHGISKTHEGSAIRLTGHTSEGVYSLGASVTVDGKTSSVPAGSVTVGDPEAQLALAASRTHSVFYPTQDWDVVFAASGGLAPYTFVSTTGLPGTISVPPGASSFALTGRASVGSYPSITLLAKDSVGKEVRSSDISVEVVGSGASISPNTTLASDAVFSATPQASAAVFGITNTGLAPSGPVAVTLGGDTTDFVLAGSCPDNVNVPAGQSCTVSLTRKPGLLDDAKTGNVTVSFANGGTATGSVASTASGFVPKVVLAPSAALAATVGKSWTFDFGSLATKSNLSASGLAWSSADKPSWMTISPSTGIGSGTPTAAASTTFSLVATDERASGTQSYTIVATDPDLTPSAFAFTNSTTGVVNTASISTPALIKDHDGVDISLGGTSHTSAAYQICTSADCSDQASGAWTTAKTSAVPTGRYVRLKLTPAAAGATISVTLVAGTAQSTWTVTAPAPLVNFTFTNCATAGPLGPTLASCRTAYGSTGPTIAMTKAGYQEWTVPTTGTYDIFASGAYGGGANNGLGGPGAQVSARFSLTAGTILTIVVGQAGSFAQTGSPLTIGGGGGGGSFVFQGTTPYLAAGGGGGGIDNSSKSWSFTTGGTANHSSTSGGSSTGGSACTGSSATLAGGSNGSGGAGSCGAGGGGFSSNGASGTNSAYGGSSIINGGGGEGGTATSTKIAAGGFGGGGAAQSNYGYGGGGGGYSGGAGGGWVNLVQYPGGGGGSFITSTAPRVPGYDARSQYGGTHGRVRITQIN